MYVLVNSDNREVGTASNFIVSVNNLIDSTAFQFKNFRVLRCQIKGAIYNVNDLNKYLSFEQTLVPGGLDPPVSSDWSIAIPNGNYNIQTLATALQAQLRGDTGVNSYTVTSSDITGKLTIQASNDGTVVFQIKGGATYPNNINKVIGLRDVTYTAVQSITSETVVDLSYCDEIRIRTNLSRASVFSDDNDQFVDVCEVIYNASSLGFQNIVYEPLRPLELQYNSIASMSFAITDKYNNTLDLGVNGQVSLCLQLF